MNTINNQFAKVYNFPDGQLLLTLEYDELSEVINRPGLTYLVLTTEREESVARIKKRFVDIYRARDEFKAYTAENAAVEYRIWQDQLKNAGTDIRLSIPAKDHSGHDHP